MKRMQFCVNMKASDYNQERYRKVALRFILSFFFQFLNFLQDQWLYIMLGQEDTGVNFLQEISAQDVRSALSLLAPQYLYSGSRSQRSACPLLTQNGDREERDEPPLRMDWNERLTFPPSGLCFQSTVRGSVVSLKRPCKAHGGLWRAQCGEEMANQTSAILREPQNQKSWAEQREGDAGKAGPCLLCPLI